MNHPTTKIDPITPEERIVSMDVLRGFAILGILLMNIQAFSMIQSAYLNPASFGDLIGLNKWVWILSHIFGDQKFMTLFAILYGAGILLISNKAESKNQSAAGLHYRRTFWLLVIGLAHAYLLWYGDILVTYALCAFVIYLFRKLSPRNLFIIGLVAISVSSLIYLFFGLSMSFWPPEAIQNLMATWNPGAEQVAKEIAAYQGGWMDQMTHRVPASIAFQTFVFLIWAGWRAGGLMLVGMALFKWGVLTGERTRRFYFILMSIGLGLGIPIVFIGIFRNFAAGWALEYSMFLGGQFNYWGSILVSMGYISAVILIYKLVAESKIITLFAGVGRTALTNYLLQTLICTGIFYGTGLGFFGRFERTQQILVVFAVWTLQLLLTSIWLRSFKFGPAEWLWRSLTYLKLQRLRN